MTRVIHDSGEGMQKEALAMVSSDVNFPKGHFPDYKIGPNNQIIDPEETHEVVPLKEIVAKETSQLLEQRRRLSVRDLKEKFEKGLSGASKLSEEAKRREAASLDRQVLLKKLRDVLDTLKGRVAGRNRDDADEAISLVEALAVQLTQREGELIYEKAEVKKLASFLKQATEDARKVAEEERALALGEIEKARAAIAKVEKGLQEHDAASSSREKEEIEGLRKEVREARRIKMLHQPSKVMDMEFELKALRNLISEKNQLCNQLMKELAMIKRLEEDSSDLFELEGSDILGSQFCIIPRFDGAPDITSCPTQWYRVISGGDRNLILGATKLTYAPEPFDVGRLLQAEIVMNAEKVTIQTNGPINPAAGLERYVDSLLKRTDVEFNVVVTQMNGNDYSSNSVHVFHIGKMRIKLRKGWSTKARESYSTTMKLCGSRGGGNAAAKAVFWQARKGLSYTLAFETDRDRNAAVMLARKFASNCNITLTGPGDQVHAAAPLPAAPLPVKARRPTWVRPNLALPLHPSFPSLYLALLPAPPPRTVPTDRTRTLTPSIDQGKVERGEGGREALAAAAARSPVELAGAEVAALAGGEEGSRAARLQSFFASVLSGLFGQGEQGEEMATRNQNDAAPPQLQNIGNVAALGKQKAVVAGRPDAKNRRALGDIGNVVNVRLPEGKPLQQAPAGHPVTRNFGAQLLKNAQANAAANKQNAIAPAAVARPAPRQARKAPAKHAPPPPEHVIEISSDSDESMKQKSEGSASSVRKCSRKKVINTLTAVLTARSKVACGISDKPRQVIDDIDKLDGDNELAVVDYIEDIYKFYKLAENECRPCDYINSQVEINSKMRAILVDWIIEVHHKFELMPETLYLSMYVIDRYLSMQPVLRRELQLVGVSSMLIACKYEEIWAPEVSDFIQISDSAYTREQILSMEKRILNRLQWNLTVPTPYVFVVRYLKAAASADIENDKEVDISLSCLTNCLPPGYSASLCVCLLSFVGYIDGAYGLLLR
ncbi:hypothetical protein GUJ93_ZPchr0001g32630 [Zizania palustris]|uniref:Cyclin-like domain-containing protein n=1 Tax=Zizania palustris TaxID=103762 RepID=A0A8J5RAB9_ZIZPA|nr:hypothetical protein GUJ93_ZPchr0001g32630 [Zizania palustris]